MLRESEDKALSRPVDIVEQKLNSTTHGIGAGLSIAGLIILLVVSADKSDVWRVVSFSLYGAFQILLYLSSNLAHIFHDMPKPYYYLRILDQAAIYLLIAGTYTPVALIAMRGNYGWTIFGIEWGLAVLGIIMKTFIFNRPHIATDLLYLPMGWLLIFFIGPLSAAVPQGLIVWIIAGGLCYTVGIIFYLMQRVPMTHVVWHLFVLAGGICFFMGFYIYLT